MDRISKLEKAHELLINGQLKESEELIRNFVLETAAEMNQFLADQAELVEDIERDQGDELKHDVAKDFDEIDAEETYDEGHEHDMEDDMCEDDISTDDAEDDLVLDLSGDEDHEEIEDRVEDLEDEFEEFHDEFAELEAEFDRLQAEEDKEHEELEAHEEHDDEIHDEEENKGEEDHTEEDEDGLSEDFHLEPVKVDMKDKSKKAFSPVLDHEDIVELGGEPVVTSKKDSAVTSKGHKIEQIKGGNTVKSGKDALIKESVETKTKATNSVASDIVKRSKANSEKKTK